MQRIVSLLSILAIVAGLSTTVTGCKRRDNPNPVNPNPQGDPLAGRVNRLSTPMWTIKVFDTGYQLELPGETKIEMVRDLDLMRPGKPKIPTFS